ncbi:MAG: hypothetical protein KBT02_09260 [Treponema sp.]|nr:hypothetical protein [Candidatus Treponema caballi]
MYLGYKFTTETFCFLKPILCSIVQLFLYQYKAVYLHQNWILQNLFQYDAPIFLTGRQPKARGCYTKKTPAEKQEQNVIEVRHISSTARQGLSAPATGISTLNDNCVLTDNLDKSRNKTGQDTYPARCSQLGRFNGVLPGNYHYSAA